jgi:hypothetical protein
MKWIPFEVYGEHPPERRHVLVQFEHADTKTGGYPPMVVVGYLRYAAGEKDSPFFVCPGVEQSYVPADPHAKVNVLGQLNRRATHWCDCLGDDFNAPLWPGTHKT